MSDGLLAFLKARLDEDAAEYGADEMWRESRTVAAHRSILEEHAPGYPVTYPEPSGRPTCGVCHAGGWDWDPHAWPCPTVRLLAAIYSDHPDYRQEWKP